MAIAALRSVSKAFAVPSIQRTTVREHVFGVLRPRRIDRLAVLEDVSFELERGETLGIMGRNGSGKSTLLKILCGIYHPDRGTVELRGSVTPILELGVGWNPELNAIDNVYLLASVMGLSLSAVASRLDGILAFAELERFAEQKLKFYSSGMAARLAYAVAFSAVQEVLVLDEIFAVGDAGFKAKCQQRYRELRAAGHTVVLVSHDPATIESFCDRALLVEGGRILLNGPPELIAARYTNLMSSTAAPH